MADNPISNNLARQGIDAQLSNQEADLVRNFLSLRDWEAAALAAGYSESTAKRAGHWATQRPAILAAIYLETARRLQTAAPGALDTVCKIEKGEIVENAKVRLDAAKAILDRAGHIAPRARALGDAGEKTLGEMSLDELKATQDRLQSEILARAKPVNAPSGPVIDNEPIDLLD